METKVPSVAGSVGEFLEFSFRFDLQSFLYHLMSMGFDHQSALLELDVLQSMEEAIRDMSVAAKEFPAGKGSCGSINGDDISSISTANNDASFRWESESLTRFQSSFRSD